MEKRRELGTAVYKVYDTHTFLIKECVPHWIYVYKDENLEWFYYFMEFSLKVRNNFLIK